MQNCYQNQTQSWDVLSSDINLTVEKITAEQSAQGVRRGWDKGGDVNLILCRGRKL